VTRRRRRIVLTTLLVPLLLYALICAAAYAWQDRMLFPAPPARETLPAGGERLALRTPDGIDLVGIGIAAAAPDPRGPLVLAFGGNGWNADDAADYLHALYPASGVAAFHYRGYPPSGGRPSARAIAADSLLVFDSVAGGIEGR
jgi:uncharacterized protein